MQPFTKKFYEKTDEGSRQSAQEVIPLVMDLIRPKSVIDVGCGLGAWLSVFRDCGVDDVLGVDGNYIDHTMLQIPPEKFIAADLMKPLHFDRQFDLVVSLEVGEHLSNESAEDFVKSLVQLGPVVLFSAAIPFQGGTQHINEQWPDYWKQKFQHQGYMVIDTLRKKIWNNEKVEYWYRQNLLLFVQEEYLKSHTILKQEYLNTNLEQLSIVHPKLYTIHCSGLTKPQHILFLIKNSLKVKMKSIFTKQNNSN